MKNIISQVRFRVLLPLLFTATLLTIPLAMTKSKYVWENTIEVQLNVVSPELSITGLFSSLPGLTISSDGSEIHMEPTATPGQWILSPAEGCALPETIQIQIDEHRYFLSTDGSQNTDALSFSPVTGLLTVSEELWNEGSLITAVGIAPQASSTDPNPKPDTETENDEPPTDPNAKPDTEAENDEPPTDPNPKPNTETESDEPPTDPNPKAEP